MLFRSAAVVELSISITVKVFEEIMAHAPVLQISMDGREAGIVLFRGSLKNEQRIIFSGRITKPICQIEFYISHTGCPAFLSQSLDGRELGFGLCGLNFAASSANEHDQTEVDFEQAATFWGVSGVEGTLKEVSYLPAGKV